jgi:hypothetical protein
MARKVIFVCNLCGSDVDVERRRVGTATTLHGSDLCGDCRTTKSIDEVLAHETEASATKRYRSTTVTPIDQIRPAAAGEATRRSRKTPKRPGVS